MLTGFRPVEVKNPTAAWFGIQPTSESGFYSCALVTEWERPYRRGKMCRKPFAVLPGLGLNASQRRSFPFGFDYANRLLIDVEQIVRKAVSRLEGEFAERDATASVEVGSGDVLDKPARLLKHLIDGCARLPFRVFHLVPFPFAYLRCRNWLG